MKATPNTLALAFFILAILIHSFVLKPLTASLNETRARVLESQSQHVLMGISLAQKEELTKDIAALKKENEKLRDVWIVPLLNSYSMRARSILAGIAEESGISTVEYADGPVLTLPIPKSGLPDLRTARRTITLKMSADYAAVASFILRAEQDVPLMAVQSIKIEPTPDCDVQSFMINLEWPCEGEVIR